MGITRPGLVPRPSGREIKRLEPIRAPAKEEKKKMSNSNIPVFALKGKSCPWCHGKMFLEADQYGQAYICINCANTEEVCQVCGKPTDKIKSFHVGGQGLVSRRECEIC